MEESSVDIPRPLTTGEIKPYDGQSREDYRLLEKIEKFGLLPDEIINLLNKAYPSEKNKLKTDLRKIIEIVDYYDYNKNNPAVKRVFNTFVDNLRNSLQPVNDIVTMPIIITMRRFQDKVTEEQRIIDKETRVLAAKQTANEYVKKEINQAVKTANITNFVTKNIQFLDKENEKLTQMVNTLEQNENNDQFDLTPYLNIKKTEEAGIQRIGHLINRLEGSDSIDKSTYEELTNKYQVFLDNVEEIAQYANDINNQRSELNEYIDQKTTDLQPIDKPYEEFFKERNQKILDIDDKEVNNDEEEEDNQDVNNNKVNDNKEEEDNQEVNNNEFIKPKNENEALIKILINMNNDAATRNGETGYKMLYNYMVPNRNKIKNLYEVLVMENKLTPTYKLLFENLAKTWDNYDQSGIRLLYDVVDISDSDLKQSDIDRFAQMNGFVKTNDGYSKGSITISAKKMKDMYLGKKLDEQLRKSRMQKLYRTPEIKDKSLLLSNKPDIIPKINPLLFKRALI